MMKIKNQLFFILFLISLQLIGQPRINNFQSNSQQIVQYDKFEVSLEIDAAYLNPYNYDEISIKAVFVSPDNQELSVDGFYMENFDLNTSSGALSASDKKFKVRFSPTQIGNWAYVFSVTDSTGSVLSSSNSFECVTNNSPKNKGFIRTNGTNYLQYDNGDQYIAIGENIGWPGNNAFGSMKNWINGLIENGANFFRFWHAHWGWGIEWKNGWRDYEGLRKYQQDNCFYQDYFFDYCADNDIHLMLTLQHHGQVSTQVNPNWSDNPYNAINEGPCINTWDFFTDSTAIAHTKNRFRYIVARWGYSRSIMAWELFNEVEWTDNFIFNKTKIQDWHSEMAAYLKEIDPYNHIVTTSYARDNNDPIVWSNPDMDITQTHVYINSSNLERALVGGNRNYLKEYEKPTLSGEFGLGGNANIANQDPDGIHFHNSLWAPLFGGSMGTGMTWWWDSYIHPQNLYPHFQAVATLTAEIPFGKENMSPTISYVTGAPEDLRFTPALDWGIVADGNITIISNGLTEPFSPRLSSFLYGSFWNTQFRSPPEFTVFYPEEGEFIVKTGANTGQFPQMIIYLNGDTVLLDTLAKINNSYAITVPAGNNIIKVDNPGIDWISIASYSFSDIGSQADTYTLISENQDMATGWVLNNLYNHQFLKDSGEPKSILGAEMVIEGLEDGNYLIEWYNCLTGAMTGSTPATSVGNQLLIVLPEIFWDVSFLINKDPDGVVSVRDQVKNLNFSVYPNPVGVGQSIHLEFSQLFDGQPIVSLLDATGHSIHSFSIDNLDDVRLNIPTNLTAGFYWLKIQNREKVGVKALVIGY